MVCDESRVRVIWVKRWEVDTEAGDYLAPSNMRPN